MTRLLPTFCYLLHNLNSSLDDLETNFDYVLDNYGGIEKFVDWHKKTDEFEMPDNRTAFVEYLETCGRTGLNYTAEISKIYRSNLNVSLEEGASMTFNWNRCVNRTSPKEFNWIVSPSSEDVIDARPATQRALYTTLWDEDQKRLEANYSLEYVTGNKSANDAFMDAFLRSVSEATGREKCAVNVASAGT